MRKHALGKLDLEDGCWKAESPCAAPVMSDAPGALGDITMLHFLSSAHGNRAVKMSMIKKCHSRELSAPSPQAVAAQGHNSASQQLIAHGS